MNMKGASLTGLKNPQFLTSKESLIKTIIQPLYVTAKARTFPLPVVNSEQIQYRDLQRANEPLSVECNSRKVLY